MSNIVAILTLSLFVTGYCVGYVPRHDFYQSDICEIFVSFWRPILWAPLSERYGRRPIFIVSFFLYVVSGINSASSYLFVYLLQLWQCTQVGSALARNTATVLVFRFLGGTFAACPLSNSGCVYDAMWLRLALIYTVHYPLVGLWYLIYGMQKREERHWPSLRSCHSLGHPSVRQSLAFLVKTRAGDGSSGSWPSLWALNLMAIVIIYLIWFEFLGRRLLGHDRCYDARNVLVWHLSILSEILESIYCRLQAHYSSVQSAET